MTIRSPQTTIAAVLVAVALLVAGAGTVFLVLPQHTKAGRVSGELTAAEQELVAAHARATTGARASAADLFRLREAMPSGDEMPEILVGLSAMAKASSVSLVSVTPSPVVATAQGYEALPLSVVIDGRYAGVTAFLRRLRQSVGDAHGRLSVSGRLFVANQIQLAPATSPPQVEATLTMDAIEYGAPAPATTSTSTSTSTSTTTTTTSG